MNIVLTPPWLVESIKAAGMPLSCAIDIEKLSSILSKEDVAFYLLLNTDLVRRRVLDAAILKTFPHSTATGELFRGNLSGPLGDRYDGLFYEWTARFRDDEHEASRELAEQMLGHNRELGANQGMCFTPHYWDEHFIALEPTTASFSELKEHKRNLQSELIRLLTFQQPFTKVVATPVFEGFVKSTIMCQNARQAAASS